MIETNIRIVEPGTKLELFTRCAKIKTLDPLPEMREKVCNQFASRGLAAVYCSIRKQFLVLTQRSISRLEVKEENRIIQVVDSGRNQRLQFSHSENDASLLAQLIERYVQIEIKRRLKMQTFDSPRIFQETRPFKTSKGIDAYRRFEVSALPIQWVGVGISVEISTAFFTRSTIADIFRDDIPDHEQQRLQEDFKFLSQRQRGQKGTLLYDLGNNQMKCYFDKFRSDLTCARTGKRIVKGKVYNSLLDYYRQKQPQLDIADDDRVAMVSFRNISDPQPVAAKLLRLRVMNDSLPRALKQVDKITPWERLRLIDSFWQRLGNDVLGHGKPRISRYFWQPCFEKVIELLPPALQFADGLTLAAPQQRNSSEFQEHYKQRLRLLHKGGCLDTPILMERTVHFAIPNKVTEETRGRLIMDVTEHLKQLTKNQINLEIVLYDTLDEVFLQLNRQSKPGIIVFVFDDQSPETYYKVAFELPNWRVKRITFRGLENKSTGNYRGWNSFTEMITLDVLQQMDCIPWGIGDEPYYDAHLAIDVGRNKRDFALSLLTFHPSLSIRTAVQRKIDSKHETINERVLHEEVVKIFNKAAERHDFQMPRSLLILRDGRECGRELEGINKAKEELIEKRLLAKTAEVDVVDFHKSIKKGIRLWERIAENRVEQILAGAAFFLDNCGVVLTTTGAPTLRQGTAAPVMLVGRSENIDIARVTRAVYASTHLNFSNPNVAQRLPLELKRTDDELRSRDSQEIRRIR
ncbi:MAG: hypothetical protein OXC79_10090 [Candidatus Poribacteria bacterium]|nr:hypothetical protein [Candidatus Poribacteria bacterium]